MRQLNLAQGSNEWIAERMRHFCASEAPAMLGVSKYMTRTELLDLKKTGIADDVDSAKQRLFDAGHSAEAMARPIAERIIGQELFQAVATVELNGLPLLASFDGIVMDESIVWENKLWNESLAQACTNDDLEPHYWAQLEHQLIVSNAHAALFTTSDGTPERTAYTWYKSIPERREQVLKGWTQFAADLQTHVPQITKAKPVGKTPESMLALRIEVTGMVTASNLAEYKAHAIAVFESINRDLVTDEQFADAEKTIKWADDVESRLAAAKRHALSQTASIDELFNAIDDISAEARRLRLELTNLVKARKDQIRSSIVADGAKALADHIATLNARIGKPYMPPVHADFAGAVKSKRTVESLKDAVGNVLANAKIEASSIADRIQINIAKLNELAADYLFLFADAPNIVLKQNDDFELMVKSRIDSHKEAEQKKAKQASDEAIAKAATVTPTVPTNAPEIAPQRTAGAAQGHSADTIRLGQICERLGFNVTAEFLSVLGFDPSSTEKNAKLYPADSFPLICRALVTHIKSVCERSAALRSRPND